MALDTYDAEIRRIIWHDVSKWSESGALYLIAETNDGKTVKGHMYDPIPGERYRFYGAWEPQRGNREGLAFYFKDHQVLVDNTPLGISTYLSRHVRGLGTTRARLVVDVIGVDCLDVLRANPDKVYEIHELPKKVQDSVKEYFENESLHDPRAYCKLAEMFADLNIPRNLIDRLLDDFGSDAPQIVVENPYILLAYPRMGWTTVDRFAISKCNYNPKGESRLQAAILEALTRLTLDGHTYGIHTDVEGIANGLCGLRPPSETWDSLIADGRIIRDRDGDGNEIDAGGSLYRKEQEIARRLRDLDDSSFKLDFEFDLSFFDGEQTRVPELFSQNGVIVVAGPPGTGKTHSVIEIVRQCRDHGLSCRVVCPTGKAAKRADELLREKVGHDQIPSTTIHRALGVTGSKVPKGASRSNAKLGRAREQWGFLRNEANPLVEDVVIVDEMSMVDVSLFCHLLRAIPPGTQLVLVGDPHQLPSVGPGSVLRDCIAGGIPTAVLETPRRNAGRIVLACHEIKNGRVPRPSAKLNLPSGENWLHLEESDPQTISDVIVELHRRTKRDPFWDLQVISPENSKKILSCDNLNKVLSRVLNPIDDDYGTGTGTGSNSDDGPVFRPGDKIVRRENGAVNLLMEPRDRSLRVPKEEAARYIAGVTGVEEDEIEQLCYDEEPAETFEWRGKSYVLGETYVVNGDLGRVEDVFRRGRGVYVVVRFVNPERLCVLPYSDHHLRLAFSITAHSSQGSGIPYVILPIHDCFYKGLMTRELLYTMFSRAEDVLVTVGKFDEIANIIRRKTIHLRKTRLASFLRWEAFRRQKIEIEVSSSPHTESV